jgi:hypothetical protein
MWILIRLFDRGSIRPLMSLMVRTKSFSVPEVQNFFLGRLFLPPEKMFA